MTVTDDRGKYFCRKILKSCKVLLRMQNYPETIVVECFITSVCVQTSAVKRSIGSTTGCTITEKAATTTFTFKTLVSIVSYSRLSIMIIALRTEFHVLIVSYV